MTRRRIPWTNVLLALGSLALSLLALEVWVSLRQPFAVTASPRRFDARVGHTYEPHAETRWTDYYEYAVTQPANTLGFLDREPPGPKAPATFRVLVLGDSFVEARQVPIAKKMHVLLEGMLARRFPDRRFETMALGYSGAGTATELAYYETFGRAFQPDLVVLVFVHNDFFDDSPLLGALAGWHPDHPPWPLFDVDADGGGFHRVGPDPDFVRHRLQVGFPAIGAVPDFAFGFRDRFASIRLVEWAFDALDRRWRWTSRREARLVALRLEELRKDERFRGKLEGWHYPDDLDHNEMFFAKEMPPVFEDAEAITDHVVGLFAEAAKRDGFRMLIAAIPPCSETPWWGRRHRELVDRGMLVRLERIAARHGLPLLDLAPAFARRGDLRAAHWRHDPHWSPTGHRWAAEAITELLASDDRFLAPAASR